MKPLLIAIGTMLSFHAFAGQADTSRIVKHFENLAQKAVVISEKLHKPTHSIEDVYDVVYQYRGLFLESHNFNKVLIAKVDTLERNSKLHNQKLDEANRKVDVANTTIGGLNKKVDLYIGDHERLQEMNLISDKGMDLLWPAFLAFFVYCLLRMTLSTPAEHEWNLKK